jgi:ATP-dependent Lon protease
MKILFPQGGASREDIEEVLKLALEGRKRVKDQLFRLDTTYAAVDFSYSGADGNSVPVVTLEEREYPNYFHQTVSDYPDEPEQKEQHLTFMENQRGVSFDELFGPYVQGASKITLTDPYIRLFYQVRNLMEFMETLVRQKAEGDEISVELLTVEDDFKSEQQADFFRQIQTALFPVGIKFHWTFDYSGTLHARHIVTDTGWKISLDRGLDIFQQYDMNNAFQLTNRIQKLRTCKAFEVTFIKL